MIRVRIFVSMMFCSAFADRAFCSEDFGTNLLQPTTKFVGSTSSKLFDEEPFEDALENILITQKAMRVFFALQDLKNSDSADSDEDIDDESQGIAIYEDYFLIGDGCDIESNLDSGDDQRPSDVEYDLLKDFNADDVHSRLGLASFDHEDSIK